MLIDALGDQADIFLFTGDPPQAYDLIESGNKLKFFTGLKLSDELFKELIFDDNSVTINKFWAKIFCYLGGIEKKEFINFQVLAWELREMYDNNEFNIEFKVNGDYYSWNLNPIEIREEFDTKQMIKYYKKKVCT